jgi:L-gulonate 5-dehydrogenase
VVKTGAGVTGFEPGQTVVVEPFIGCGKCYPCRVGKSNCCANLTILGVHKPGGYAEYLTAPAQNVHPVPDGLALFEATFAEPVAIAVQGCRRGEVGQEYVLVLGCGPIGLALIEVGKARGARVVATDISESRLETAAQLGAEVLLTDEHLLDRVMAQTNGEGAPVVMEATGSVMAMESTVDLVAAGGRIVIQGIVPRGVNIAFPGLDITRKEMTIIGARASVNCFPEALLLLASGAIHYPKIATAFSMWDAPTVFSDLNENPGKVHKGVLVRE